jgi:hypothetical protein
MVDYLYSSHVKHIGLLPTAFAWKFSSLVEPFESKLLYHRLLVDMAQYSSNDGDSIPIGADSQPLSSLEPSISENDSTHSSMKSMLKLQSNFNIAFIE